jgi:uncharacterized membrane protein
VTRESRERQIASGAMPRFARAVVAVALFAIVLGIGARVDSLGHKLFWQDEAISMLRITGHQAPDLDRLFDGRLHPATELLALDRLDPRLGLGATVASLHAEPQRGPLFYILARLWVDAFGDDVARARLLSALIGIASIGFAFLLGRRLGGSYVAGAVLAALFALSPMQIRFSQQIREYEMIAAATLASSWLLLRALERPSTVRVITYAIALGIGIYTSPLFVATVVAHGATAIVAARRDGRAPFLAWVAATVAAAIVAAPWMLQSIKGAQAHVGDLDWVQGQFTLKSLALKWAFNIGAVFFDSEFARIRLGFVLAPLLLVVALAFASAFVRPRDAVARALMVALTVCSALPVILLDIVERAHFEAVTRYQMTTWIGISIIVALLIVRGLSEGANLARFALACFVFVLGCGAFSAALDRPYVLWWDNNEHIDESAVGAKIAAGTAPALVVASGAAAGNTLVLSRYVPPDTTMLLYGRVLPALPATPRGAYFFVPLESVVNDVDRRVAPGSALRNVSPDIGITIPDLRSERDAQAYAIRAENALWQIVPATAPR